MLKLHGIFPPIATPFDHHGDLYKIKVQHNIEKWNRTGLAGYVVCGSTGESVYLTTEEKIRLWEWVAEYAAPEKLLVAGTGVEGVRGPGVIGTYLHGAFEHPARGLVDAYVMVRKL